MAVESEFVFELQVCHWAERAWPPDGELDDDAVVLVARQLGTRRRRWDTVVIECDRAGLVRRNHFGADELDSDLLHVVRNAPADWAWYQDALPHPGYPWRYVREAVHLAADRGLVERRHGSNGRIELRRKWMYPDWVRRIVAIENKPDLDASAARALAPQIERDVALSLADEVWVATAATGSTVEPALLEDLPVDAGILTIDTESAPDLDVETSDHGLDAETPDSGRDADAHDPRPGAAVADGSAASAAAMASVASVAWHPSSLAVEDPGTRIIERPDGGTHDASAARFEYADPEWKREKRLEIAERAYGRGWRSYAESMRPDCRHFELVPTACGDLPRCAAKGIHQSASQCSGNCPDFEPEPPVWRTRNWPIDGGPGAGIKRLLDRQRRRRRPGLSGDD